MQKETKQPDLLHISETYQKKLLKSYPKIHLIYLATGLIYNNPGIDK